MPWMKEEDGAVVVNVWLQPRASKNKLVGIYGDCLKIKVTSPPVDNRANEKLCDYLAGLMGMSKRDINIIKGGKMRTKKVKIVGRTLDDVRECVSEELGYAGDSTP